MSLHRIPPLPFNCYAVTRFSPSQAHHAPHTGPRRTTDAMPIPPLPFHRWENPHSQRYYLAHVYIDLLGDVVLSSYWGGLQSRLGGQRHEAFATPESAQARLAEIYSQRAKRHYQVRS